MKQPEALRLADALDCHEHVGMSKAAAELRRLHEANKAMLEALKSLEGVGSVIKWDGQWELCIAAIAKGEQA